MNRNISKPMLPIALIIIHVVLGYAISLSSVIAMTWSIIIIILGFYRIITKHNRNEEAAMWSAYIAVSDVPLRACGGALVWEIGKLGIVAFLVAGLLFEQKGKWKLPAAAFIMLLLLIPGAAMTFSWSDNPREALTFNLSGMVCLLTSMAYFYNRTISHTAIKKIFAYSLLPLISLSFLLFFRTPDVRTITFTSDANFVTSGGFGPNQVATILGYGWLLILVLITMQEKVTSSKWITYAILAFFLYRSLFTFSRGGNLAALLALVSFVWIYMKSGQKRVNISRSFRSLIIFGILAVSVVVSINTITGGMFENRFTGKTTDGEQREDVTTGRADIMALDYELFIENPLGVGAGGSSYFRRIEFQDEHASHNEFTRLLSEHGIFGVIIILMMLIKPITYNRKIPEGENRAYCMMFFILCVMSMMHSGCRTALPELIYGFSFILIKETT